MPHRSGRPLGAGRHFGRRTRYRTTRTTTRQRQYASWNMRQNASEISVHPLFIALYYPARFLLLGWWIYVAYETSMIWRQFKLTPDFKGLEHGLDAYNAIGLLYPVSIVYIFWSMISCAAAYKIFHRGWLIGLAIPEAFFLTLICVSLALQVKSLPAPTGSCSNADSWPIFEAITKALPWICETHSVGENESYKTCTETNTNQLTCGYFKANWRATIVSLVFSAINMLVDIWCLVTHKTVITSFGYVPASFRFVGRVMIRPAREMYYRFAYKRRAAKEKSAEGSGGSLGKSNKWNQYKRVSRSPSTHSQKDAGIQLSVLPVNDNVLHIPGKTAITYLPRIPNQSALERFLRVDDMFLTLAQFVHSWDLQRLTLSSKTLAEIVEYHKAQNGPFLARNICFQDARSGESCWACGMLGCTNCFSLQPTETIPADEVEHQADHIEALCTDCYYKHLNPIKVHVPDELARAYSQQRPVYRHDCGFNAPRLEGRPAHSSTPEDRARAMVAYSRYCNCATYGVERTLCAGCRVAYRVEDKRLQGAREAGDGLREIRRQRQAREIAQGKTPSSRTGDNQDCVYCSKNLQKWWQMRWWRCEVCWEELRTKLV